MCCAFSDYARQQVEQVHLHSNQVEQVHLHSNQVEQVHLHSNQVEQVHLHSHQVDQDFRLRVCDGVRACVRAYVRACACVCVREEVLGLASALAMYDRVCLVEARVGARGRRREEGGV